MMFHIKKRKPNNPDLRLHYSITAIIAYISIDSQCFLCFKQRYDSYHWQTSEM